MQWMCSLVVVILVFLPVTGSALSEPNVCDGKYKDGSKPDQTALKIILSNHSNWLEERSVKNKDTRRANLCNADLRGVNLSGVSLPRANLSGAILKGADLSRSNLSKADLGGADLSKAYLFETNLYGANLYRANLSKTNFYYTDLREAMLFEADLRWASLNESILSKANLSRANLSGADMTGSDLSGAKLISANLSNTYLGYANLRGADLSEAALIKSRFIDTILDNAIFTNINLESVTYEPSSTPNKAFLSGIRNLHTVYFHREKQSGLVSLRNSLKDSGLRELEREATYAIEKGKTDNTTSLFVKFMRRFFFEITAEYGLHPERCLIILISFIPGFSLIYFFSIYRKKESVGQRRSGIYRIWLEDRIHKNPDKEKPELINAGFVKSLVYASYFSLLSAFHIGWRDINVSNWITRMQPQEYTLRSIGWVRTVSGIQSLISVYLLAFWVLTQFGRPFG